MSQAEAISKAYEIIAVLIQGFLTDMIGCQNDNDRQVLKVLDELRQHCEEHSRVLSRMSQQDREIIGQIIGMYCEK